MKIGLICPADFTVLLCCKWIIKNLQNKGYEVIVISPLSQDNFFIKEILKFNVVHVNIKMNRHVNVLDDFKYIIDLYKIFKKHNINSLFSVCTKPNIYSPLAGKLAGIKKIYTSIWGRGTAFLESQKFKDIILKLIILFLYKISFQISNLVWFTNPNDLNYFLSKKLIKKEKTILTYNYIDSEIYKPQKITNNQLNNLRREFQLKENDFIIILVGRMIWSKGIKEFVEAGRILYKKYPNLKLLLVGAEEKNNPDAIPNDYLKKISKLEYLKWAKFRKDVPLLYCLSKIAVLPSYYKEGGYPRAVTEPMSIGIPVIAADTPDCRGPIENMKNGILISPKRPDELAEKIKLLIEDKKLYDKLSLSGRTTIIEKFDEKKIIKKLIDEIF